MGGHGSSMSPLGLTQAKRGAAGVGSLCPSSPPPRPRASPPAAPVPAGDQHRHCLVLVGLVELCFS